MISPDTVNKLNTIITIVEHNMSVPAGAALSPVRKRERVDARRMAVYIAFSVLKKDFERERTKLQEIGNCVDKSHSTILYYRDSMPNLIDSDANLRKIYLTSLEESAALFDPTHIINSYVNIPQL